MAATPSGIDPLAPIPGFRPLATLLAAIVLGLPVAVAAQPAANDKTLSRNTTPSGHWRRELPAIEALFDSGRFAEADARLARALDDRRFAGLDPGVQHDLLALAGSTAIQLERNDRALALYQRAVAADPDVAYDWYLLAALEADRGNLEAAAAHMTRRVQRWPDSLDAIDELLVFQMINQLEPLPAARRSLLQALFDAHWQPKGIEPAGAWLELAVLQLQDDDNARVRATLARIDTPMELVRVRADRRFDAFIERTAPRFDPSLAARRHLDAMRVRNLLQPERMAVLMELSYALLTVGDDEEVLRISEAVATSLVDPRMAAAYEDLDDFVWLLNNRAIALRRLGRTDEAVATLETASRLSERGDPNVSQVLNLAMLYAGLGRADEALGILASVGQMSDYGRSVQQLATLRAMMLRGDGDGIDQALAQLHELRHAAPQNHLWGLVVAERMDEAEATLVGLLQSPQERNATLAELQDYRRPPPLPADIATHARWQQLRARPAVQAALAEVGRIERYDIHSGHSMR